MTTLTTSISPLTNSPLHHSTELRTGVFRVLNYVTSEPSMALSGEAALTAGAEPEIGSAN